jgi:hypothetical protein
VFISRSGRSAKRNRNQWPRRADSAEISLGIPRKCDLTHAYQTMQLRPGPLDPGRMLRNNPPASVRSTSPRDGAGQRAPGCSGCLRTRPDAGRPDDPPCFRRWRTQRGTCPSTARTPCRPKIITPRLAWCESPYRQRVSSSRQRIDLLFIATWTHTAKMPLVLDRQRPTSFAGASLGRLDDDQFGTGRAAVTRR